MSNKVPLTHDLKLECNDSPCYYMIVSTFTLYVLIKSLFRLNDYFCFIYFWCCLTLCAPETYDVNIHFLLIGWSFSKILYFCRSICFPRLRQHYHRHHHHCHRYHHYSCQCCYYYFTFYTFLIFHLWHNDNWLTASAGSRGETLWAGSFLWCDL